MINAVSRFRDHHFHIAFPGVAQKEIEVLVVGRDCINNQCCRLPYIHSEANQFDEKISVLSPAEHPLRVNSQHGAFFDPFENERDHFFVGRAYDGNDVAMRRQRDRDRNEVTHP